MTAIETQSVELELDSKKMESRVGITRLLSNSVGSCKITIHFTDFKFVGRRYNVNSRLN